MSTSLAERFVYEINHLNLQHRRGWFSSEKPDAIDILPDLEKEIKELRESLERYEVVRRMPEIDGLGNNVREELADVFACVLQIAFRLGMSFAELDREAVRKLTLRFIGAERIQM